MSSPAADAWKEVADWNVVAYEVRMFRATYEVVLNDDEFDKLSRMLRNAVEESAVLHTRILCDIFLSNSGEPDDIILSKLMPGWHRRNNPEYDMLKTLVSNLRNQYQDPNNANSYRWIFNKMMAHPTKHRGFTYEYRPILSDLRPTLQEIIAEIERLRKRPFTWVW
jgi:hypothetical protein